MAKPKIPWRDIDPGMRPIIKELNRLGLETTTCCEGHIREGKAYLSFNLDNVETIMTQIDTKPPRLTIYWKRGLLKKRRKR